MSSPFELREADETDLPAIFAKVHEFWGRGQTLDAYVAQRMASPQHRRARWYIASRGDTMVSSLGAYPIAFHRQGHVVSGMAIGSVHTRPDYRGQGGAPALLQYVERVEHDRGVEMSVLYSDIDPTYYAKLGYQLCPSYTGWSSPSGAWHAEESTWQVEPFDGAGRVEQMKKFYEADHGRRRLAVSRDDAYWRHLFPKRPGDRFLWLYDAQGSTRGYVRLEQAGGDLKMTDIAVPEASDEEMEQVYRAVQAYAAGLNRARLGGWLPDTAAVRRCFSLEPRSREITMLKPLGSADALGDDLLAAAMHFQEIDHV